MKRNPDRDERSPHQRTGRTRAGAALAYAGPAAARHWRLTSTGKWQLALMGVAMLLAAMLFFWLGSGGTGYSTAAQAISTEHKNAEGSYDNHAPRAMEANSQFMERARAIETGFKAAFLFHS